MSCSEVLAAEAVSCLNKALCHLKDIWEEIGIPEDQRLQRTNVVKNHIKVTVAMGNTRVYAHIKHGQLQLQSKVC